MIIVRVLLGRGLTAKTTMAFTSGPPQFVSVTNATTDVSGATESTAIGNRSKSVLSQEKEGSVSGEAV